ncbi:class I SAM-dependent methyltransferase [Gallaecimonas pentaromativorans]|uniref:class I SAM-dependent methyltransferase n=1 Tax=Gallaecimonas pentaromativorans TaxID=584787 RepID=UPI003A948842
MTPLRYRYQTLEFASADIHLCTLRDRQQFDDPAGLAEKLGISSASWPIFGIVWPSSLALARFIDGYDTGSKRILEVGCGIGLPSLLLNARSADITATDYHPEVGRFLARNTVLNDGADIAFERTGWADENDALGLFDLIIGSDLLYEDQHIALLANFINTHAKPTSEVILVDPGRGRKSKLISAMSQFGYRNTYRPLPVDIAPDFKGYILKFER